MGSSRETRIRIQLWDLLKVGIEVAFAGRLEGWNLIGMDIFQEI